jgi:methionyl-tRNA synthetase
VAGAARTRFSQERRVEPRFVQNVTRPKFPARAVVTAGMPYGNKDLHFGHVGGVFVHADAFARFMRDRIGAENVAFVSGTDCFGSPIVADHADKVAKGLFTGDLNEFVQFNHARQRETLDAYAIGLDAFAASSLEPYVSIHRDLGADIMLSLHRNGHLQKRTTVQFYDAERQTFLNGRQVVGRCPVDGCQSEKAYADECSLGHQYEPADLIAPVSTLTGKTPEKRGVTNWYVPLEKFKDVLRPWLEEQGKTGAWREYAVRVVLENFEPPTIHVQREHLEGQEALLATLPPYRREPGRGKSDKLIFERLDDLDAAKAILTENRVRYRTGKTLVPFRLTGNLEWGLPAPDLEGVSGLTFWVWPESLWAPISFTAALMQKRGLPIEEWRKWWCAKDGGIYQFIGEDNLFFYGLAELAMWLGYSGDGKSADAPDGHLQLPHIVANRHLLFLDKKASSSGTVKPPMGRDLLNYYTTDQLRIHFLSLALGARNVSFRPKPLDPAAANDPRIHDPVMKDANVLTNAFNRSVRSCFYTAQKYYDRALPAGEVSEDVLRLSESAILSFEAAMAGHEIHAAIEGVAAFIAQINQRWTKAAPMKDETDGEVRRQALIDAFHMVRVATTLLHPIAPVGTEKIRATLGVGEELWDWRTIFAPLTALMKDPAGHRFAELPPRADFFEKHPSQLSEGE